MRVTFLTADKPLRKEYRIDPDNPGSIKELSYPHVYKFSSKDYELDTIEEFFTAIQEYAANDGCILKGVSRRSLENESRAGNTDPNALTEWICLDLDGIKGYLDVDHALKDFGCQEVDYILQWSASHGIQNQELRCHIFFLLESPWHPEALKRWLKHLNFTHLKNQIRLASSHNSLVWPLDISTCQNDKLLYIAPPKIQFGIPDPFFGKERISLHKRSSRVLSIPEPPSLDRIHAAEVKVLNRARKREGLSARRAYKLSLEEDVEFLKNPDKAEITGQKTERGFVYFNLNGGDSWGYYHPENNPAFIYNFKGEPVYRTKDLLPSYWRDLKSRVNRMEPDASGTIYLAFRDFESSVYWNGIYDSKQDRILKLAPAKSISQLQHFLKQHGQPIGDFIPDWEMEWNPHEHYTVDRARKKLNTYIPSRFMETKPSAVTTVPSTIEHVIRHALGNHDKVYEHFLNWLAVIFQTKDMTQTAWLIHGTQGTGKGVMFNYILTPLLGAQNVTARRMEELGSDFTEFMKNKFLVFIDEVQSGRALFHDKVTAKLKNLIVEPYISVREMYRPAQLMRNYANLIFASNSPQPLTISSDDRRFNVGKYQETPISLTSSDIQNIEYELDAFYSYLCTRTADENLARSPIITTDRVQIIRASQQSIDIAIEALRKGDLDFFADQIVESESRVAPHLLSVYLDYVEMVKEIMTTKKTRFSRDELMILFRWCVDNLPSTPNKFTALLRHHALHLRPMNDGGRSYRGYEVGEWHTSKNE